jgi:hypothetical protein
MRGGKRGMHPVIAESLSYLTIFCISADIQMRRSPERRRGRISLKGLSINIRIKKNSTQFILSIVARIFSPYRLLKALKFSACC